MERVKAQNVREGVSRTSALHGNGSRQGPVPFSSDAYFHYYGFQINILFDLSIIYQYLSMQSFRDDSAGSWIIKHDHKN